MSSGKTFHRALFDVLPSLSEDIVQYVYRKWAAMSDTNLGDFHFPTMSSDPDVVEQLMWESTFFTRNNLCK